MFSKDPHGGGCCGILHISDFPDPDLEEGRVDALSEKVKEIKSFWGKYRSDESVLIEAVLTQSQASQWHHHLEELGFKVVNSFRNTNSGRLLYIYHCNNPAIAKDHEFVPS